VKAEIPPLKANRRRGPLVGEIEARAIDEDGRGVGRAGDLEIRVADLLPGERAEVAVEHESRHRARAWGSIVCRTGPLSADRATPTCPAFGRCGGCAWQHLAYPAQLEAKRRRLESALGGAAAVGPVTAAPAELGYRNRGKYVFATAGGELVVGAYQRRSHQVVSTLGCRVVEPGIDAAARSLAAAVAGAGLTVYDEASRRGQVRYAVIRAGHRGEVAAALVTTSSTPRSALETIAAAVVPAAAAGLRWVRNDEPGNVLLAGEAEGVAGRQSVGERAGGVELQVPIASFWQVNRAQADRIDRRIGELLALEPGARVLDAYAGAGAIGLTLAASGAAVTAVERDADAAEAGRRAAAGAGLAVSFEAGDAAAALARDGFDAAVVNPPRKGLALEARRALAAAGPPRLAYLSCGPASLARDLAELGEAGYRLVTLEAFDLMPGTAEVETLAILRRSRTDRS
jgi:23S rRNA (uracil1939-C5)-methyltransferase